MRPILYSILCLLYCIPVLSQIGEKTEGLEKYDGYFNFYYDESKDKIFLEVDKLDHEFLYVYALSSGVGSNDIGLDRGQLGNEQVVYFKKTGNKLLLVQPNLKFRAITENDLERKSVGEAFASSVLYGFEIEAEEKGRYLVDFTPFLMQDMHGVSQRLKRTGQGSYSIDKSRSAINLDRTKAFPENVEFDALLTFKGEPKGGYVRSVAPNPGLVTVTQHHSFLKLPEPGFEKREFDPRSGSYPFSYYDYASPVNESLVKRFIRRHRLEKKDPAASQSEAVEPIIYYLDNGTPEPVRSALLEGGKWWNQAFEAIGYKDAFQVRMLPEDVDPLDARYNVIQWVHRSTRGWSYGSSITDPRTGEIIKGHVSLGSLRIRQDYLIAQALSSRPFENEDGSDQAMMELALARIRQLSAHEIGHTLGFAHNFAASTNSRASVMDYPHPQVRLEGGEVSFQAAYDTGIGEWDKVTVAYAYSDFPDGTDHNEALNQILSEAHSRGLRYLSDQDARPAGSASSIAHLWDNGGEAAEELEKVLQLRAKAIENFSVDNIRQGQPYSVLEDVFVPLYLYHRYQAEAVAKVIGGLDYNYAVKGGPELTVKPAPAKAQEKALEKLLKTLDASVIAVPQDKLPLFPPRAIGYSRSRESFKGRMGVAFDALAAAETAADHSLRFLLHPERASRLVLQAATDKKQPGLQDVLEELLSATMEKSHKDPYLQEVQEVINFRVLDYIFHLASSDAPHPQVTATTYAILERLKEQKNQEKSLQAKEMVRRIKTFLKEPADYQLPDSPKIPDGSPIGMACTN